MVKVPAKLEISPKSVFSLMSEKSREYSAINLGQGFPGFNCSERLLEILKKNINLISHQYAPAYGLPKLREKIAGKINNLYGVNKDPETEITVIPGATYGIYTGVSAFVNPGDKVIVFEPYYENYIPSILLHSGKPVVVPLKGNSADWEAFDDCFDSSVKLVIINSPHNPSTRVLSEEFYEVLARKVEGTNTLILSDEVYEHLVFDGLSHKTVIAHPKLRDRSIGVFSFGKTYGITGWKTGYAVAPPEIMREYRKAHSNQHFSVNCLPQQTLAEFLEFPEEYLNLGKFYEEKRNILFDGLKSSSLFKPMEAEGTFFILADYGNLSCLPDFDFCMRLVEKHGVSSIPLSPFYQGGSNEKIVRLCFAQTDETLKKAVDVLSGLKEV